jgi:RHS repeat-associated protein
VLGNGELLSQKKGTSAPNYFLKDGQGSVRNLVDGNGALISGQSYSYDAFGKLLSGQTSPVTNYLYTGQQFDPLSGLYDLRARYYNPGDGRFLSRDTYPVNFNNPIELGRYSYTADNPINASDPSGYLLEYNAVQNLVRQGSIRKALATIGRIALELLIEGVISFATTRIVQLLTSSVNIPTNQLIIDEQTRDHILKGGVGVNGFYGYHYRPEGKDVLNINARVDPQFKINRTRSGIYKAPVEYWNGSQWIRAKDADSSTFFPDNMLPSDVMNAVSEAISDPNAYSSSDGELVGSATWQGERFNIKIQYEVGTYRVITAYPFI